MRQLSERQHSLTFSDDEQGLKYLYNSMSQARIDGLTLKVWFRKINGNQNK